MLKRLPGLAIIVLCLSCLPFVAAQEDALRQEALGLNDFMILGDTDAEQRQSVDEKVQDLLRDADHAKKLLATAAKMTGPKETPFTYSAAFILGALARKLRDVESGQLFYYL